MDVWRPSESTSTWLGAPRTWAAQHCLGLIHPCRRFIQACRVPSSVAALATRTRVDRTFLVSSTLSRAVRASRSVPWPRRQLEQHHVGVQHQMSQTPCLPAQRVSHSQCRGRRPTPQERIACGSCSFSTLGVRFPTWRGSAMGRYRQFV